MNLLHLTSVEMRRALHRRMVWWMCLLALAGCAFMGLIAFITVASTDVRFEEHPGIMRNWVIDGEGESLLGIAAVFLAIGAAVCGSSVAGAEWKHGTITTVLTWAPSRWRLHAARTLSAAVLAFLIGFALQIVWLASAVPSVLRNGTTEGTDGEYWRELVVGMLRISFITALVAVLALSIATVARNTTPGLVVLAAWALIGEQIVRGLKPSFGRYLISENVAIVVPWKPLTDVEFDRSPAVALTNLLLYLGIAVAIALFSFTQRDVAGSS